MADPVERITNLMSLLLESSALLTFEEIADRLGLYEGEPDARRARFERDKRQLRELGVTLYQEVVAGGATGYTIRPDDFYLDVSLSPEERLALQLAAAAVRFDVTDDGQVADWDDHAAVKLGGTLVQRTPVLASLPAADALPALHEASRRRAPVSFEYRGKARTVDPYGLVFRKGFWYVVGREHEPDQVKTFRVDRIGGTVTRKSDHAFTIPEDFDPGAVVPADALRLGDGDVVVAEVLVDRVAAGQAERDLGPASVVTRHADGSVVVRAEATNNDAFRSWLLGFLDHAEVISPPALREEVVGWLQALADVTDPAGAR